MPLIIIVDNALTMLAPFSASISQLGEATLAAKEIVAAVKSVNKLEQFIVAPLSCLEGSFCKIPAVSITSPKSAAPNFAAFLTALDTLPSQHWGPSPNCTVCLFTDGGRSSQLAAALEALPADTHFKIDLHVWPLASAAPCEEILPRLIALCDHGTIHSTTRPRIDSVSWATRRFSPCAVQLRCGELRTTGTLTPRISLQGSGTCAVECSAEHSLIVIGFLLSCNLAQTPCVSRHLFGDFTAADAPESAKEPSALVLLHTALRTQAALALVLIDASTHALVYQSSTKNRSSLFLAVITKEMVPSLGTISQLDIEPGLSPAMLSNRFPREAGVKRSYSEAGSHVTWFTDVGLQADISKLLRLARRLPDKSAAFYRELNKIRASAIALGFPGLLDALSELLATEPAAIHATGSLLKPKHRLYHEDIPALHV